MPNDELIDESQNGGTDAGGSDNGGNPPPPNGDVQFATMSEREKALVEKARGEEKRKLYRKQQEQDTQIKDLQRQIREMQTAPPPSTETGRQSRDDRMDRLMDAITSLSESQRQTNERLDRMQGEEENRRRRTDLDRYADTLVAQVRATGDDVVEGLVGGDSEEQIENSVKIARAEWFLIVQKERERAQRGNGRNGAPSSVTVQTSGRRPAGTPPVQVPNSVEADNHENIDELTSQDAVRSGDYEKNRSKLWGNLKRSTRYVGNSPA
jgi:hypothetical protein